MGAVKFTFDTQFGAPEEAGGEAQARKSYTPNEIEGLKTEARQEGRSEAQVRATEALAAATARVGACILTAIQAMDGQIEAIRGEAASIAFAAAKKLAGAAMAAVPEEEIAQALHAAMHLAIGEPRVVVRISPALIQRIEPRATEIAAQEGYEGRLQVVADSALSGADCRIEWKGGGIERAEHAIQEALAELIARRFPPGGT